MAFEVKKEMKLAPLNRATLDGESRVTLDTLLKTQVRTSMKKYHVLWSFYVILLSWLLGIGHFYS